MAISVLWQSDGIGSFFFPVFSAPNLIRFQRLGERPFADALRLLDWIQKFDSTVGKMQGYLNMLLG